jgi:hypothetical protein
MVRLRLLLAFALWSSFPLPSFSVSSEEYYKAGLSLYNQGDHARAIQYLKAAVQVDPNNWQANQVLGYAHYKSGDKAKALAAFDESIRVHPNPSLQTFADKMRPTQDPGLPALEPGGLEPVTEPTAPSPAAQSEPWRERTSSAQPEKTDVPRVFRQKKWLEVRGGAAFATLGDLAGASQAFMDNFSGYNPIAENSSLGVAMGVLGTIALDDANAVGLEVGTGIFGGLLQFTDPGLGTYINESYKPTMVDVELKYLRLIPMGGARLRGELGAGLYMTNLAMSSQGDFGFGSYTINGTMMGFGFGATLGATLDFPLGRDMALGAYLRGRYATTSGMQGTFEDQFGDQYELGFAQSDGMVGFTTVSNIGTGGLEWGVIDYTGAEGGITLTITY